MRDKARYATVHRIRFRDVTTPDRLDLSRSPTGALSWKIGPSGPVGPDGYRLPANVWCAVGMYRDSEAAEAAQQRKESVMPFLSDALESWHALLLPFAHKGECNHLDRNEPGPVFDIGSPGSGGPCFVITTAGFNFGPDLKIERVINFRRNVDTTNEWIARAEGCLASQVFTPHTVGDDGFTMSIWRADAAMLEAAYRPGFHRSQIERHKVDSLFDRSSFTRFRILDSSGLWDGRDPLRSDTR